MPTKSVAAKVKATAAEDTSLKDGQFTALASVFNNIDAVGDVVMPGAFTDDLKAWEESGTPIPVYWSHRMEDPHMNVGSVLEAKETETGLLVKAQLDLENPTAVQVYRLLKGGRVNHMSFAYDIQDAAPAERDGASVYELRKLKLHEVSVVQVPANPEAVIHSVKTAIVNGVPVPASSGDIAMATTTTTGAIPGWFTFANGTWTQVPAMSLDGLKVGRTISAKNETTLRDALVKIAGGVADVKSVLDGLDSSSGGDSADAEEPKNTSTEGKASPAQPAAAEKADEPSVAGVRSSPADTLLRINLAALADEVDQD